MKVYICADLHFSHNNIIKYENRPFKDAEEMNKALIENWNEVVRDEDKVFVLGDVSFGPKEKVVQNVQSLKGQKILIMGNHDRARNPVFWREAGFKHVSPYPIVYREYLVLSHEPPTYFNAATPYFYIYGHVHSTSAYPDWTDNTACVSIERLNYRPALLDDVISGEAYKWKRLF